MYPGKKLASRCKIPETFQETGNAGAGLAGVGQVGQKLQLPEDSSRKLSPLLRLGPIPSPQNSMWRGIAVWTMVQRVNLQGSRLPDQNPCLSHKAIWAGLRCLTQILVTDMDPQQSHPSRVAHKKGEKDLLRD